MKKVCAAILLLISLKCFGQKVNVQVGTPNQVQKPAAMAPDSSLQTPTGCGLPNASFVSRYLSVNRKALLYHDTCAGKFYVYNLKSAAWAAMVDSTELHALDWDATLNVSPDFISDHASNFHTHDWYIDSAHHIELNVYNYDGGGNEYITLNGKSITGDTISSVGAASSSAFIFGGRSGNSIQSNVVAYSDGYVLLSANNPFVGYSQMTIFPDSISLSAGVNGIRFNGNIKSDYLGLADTAILVADGAGNFLSKPRSWLNTIHSNDTLQGNGNNFVFNNTRVKIVPPGTTSLSDPRATLDVAGDIFFQRRLVGTQISGTGRWQFGTKGDTTTAGGNLIISNPNAPDSNRYVMTFQFGSGNIGIGQVNPAGELDIAPPGVDTATLILRPAPNLSNTVPNGSITHYNNALYAMLNGTQVRIDNNGPSTIDTFRTIPAMVASSTQATSAYVSDSVRGGLFHYMPQNLSTNTFGKFAATGKGGGTWVRLVTDNKWFVGWTGASPDSSARTNLNYIQNMLDSVPRYAIVYGDLTKRLLIDSSLYIRQPLQFQSTWLKAQINPLVTQAQLQDMVRAQSDSVTIENNTFDGSSGSVVDDALRFDAILFRNATTTTITAATARNNRIYNVRKNAVEFNHVSVGRIEGNLTDSAYRDNVSIVKCKNITVIDNKSNHSLSGGGGEVSDSSSDISWVNNQARNSVYAIDIDVHSATDVNTRVVVSNLFSDSNQYFINHGTYTSTQSDVTFKDCIANNTLTAEINLGGNIDNWRFDNFTITNSLNTSAHVTIQRANNLAFTNAHFKGLFTSRLLDLKTAISGQAANVGLNVSLDVDSVQTTTNVVSITNYTGVTASNIRIKGTSAQSGNLLSLVQVSDASLINNNLQTSTGAAILYAPTSTQSNIRVLNNTTAGTTGVAFTGNFFTTYTVENSGAFNKTAGIGTSIAMISGLQNGSSTDSILSIKGDTLRKILPVDGYTLQGSSGNQSPADGANIYVGPNAAAAGGTANVNRLYIPRSGTIKKAYVTYYNAGTLGTNETSTVNIRLNNTSNTAISAAVDNSSTFQALNNTALGIVVSAGDYIELLWVCPTWSTNPTNVRISFTIYIE